MPHRLCFPVVLCPLLFAPGWPLDNSCRVPWEVEEFKAVSLLQRSAESRKESTKNRHTSQVEKLILKLGAETGNILDVATENVDTEKGGEALQAGPEASAVQPPVTERTVLGQVVESLDPGSHVRLKALSHPSLSLLQFMAPARLDGKVPDYLKTNSVASMLRLPEQPGEVALAVLWVCMLAVLAVAVMSASPEK